MYGPSGIVIASISVDDIGSSLLTLYSSPTFWRNRELLGQMNEAVKLLIQNAVQENGDWLF